jgi:hypothetical protein
LSGLLGGMGPDDGGHRRYAREDQKHGKHDREGAEPPACPGLGLETAFPLGLLSGLEVPLPPGCGLLGDAPFLSSMSSSAWTGW